MFTGIIEEVGRVAVVRPDRLVISATLVLKDTAKGSSISVNGVCLTVTDFTPSSFSVDVMAETLRRSNLGLLKPGDVVNLERAMALGGRMGGHLVEGHVDATGKVIAIRSEGGAVLIRFEAPADVMYYVVEKGFIAVDGISLTVSKKDEHTFEVSVVDYTRRHTNLERRRAGDIVNLETDVIAKYVAQLTQVQGKGITEEFLKEHGFAW